MQCYVQQSIEKRIWTIDAGITLLIYFYTLEKKNEIKIKKSKVSKYSSKYNN